MIEFYKYLYCLSDPKWKKFLQRDIVIEIAFQIVE